MFSHEHEDHFSISTLDRLDRRIPIWLSVRSSAAARAILDEMGFSVHRLVPGHDSANVADPDLLIGGGPPDGAVFVVSVGSPPRRPPLSLLTV